MQIYIYKYVYLSFFHIQAHILHHLSWTNMITKMSGTKSIGHMRLKWRWCTAPRLEKTKSCKLAQTPHSNSWEKRWRADNQVCFAATAPGNLIALDHELLYIPKYIEWSHLCNSQSFAEMSRNRTLISSTAAKPNQKTAVCGPEESGAWKNELKPDWAELLLLLLKTTSYKLLKRVCHRMVRRPVTNGHGGFLNNT